MRHFIPRRLPHTIYQFFDFRYWERADGRLIEDGTKYKIENSYMKYGYITVMRLTIKRVISHDFTEYHCISKNELLATKGKILLRGTQIWFILTSSSC